MAARVAHPPPSPIWRYCDTRAETIVEVGFVQGCDVGLPAHFHDEDQLTFVVTGRRRFQLGGAVVGLSAGQGLVIPAGVPHRSLDEPDGVAALNLYLKPGACNADAVLAAAADRWRATRGLEAKALVAIADAYRRLAVATASLGAVPTRVDPAPTNRRLSREGFSRAFRRRHGMPPHAFGRIVRLNAARDLLRQGEHLAAIAAETGFTDQSHFGRCFRRTFGVTPGLYRAGWSQTYQTGV